MKSKNITFCMPANLIEQLQAVAGKRGLSKFVVKTLERAVKEEEDRLKAAYQAANSDPDRLKTIEEWSAIDTENWDE